MKKMVYSDSVCIDGIGEVGTFTVYELGCSRHHKNGKKSAPRKLSPERLSLIEEIFCRLGNSDHAKWRDGSGTVFELGKIKTLAQVTCDPGLPTYVLASTVGTNYSYVYISKDGTVSGGEDGFDLKGALAACQEEIAAWSGATLGVVDRANLENLISAR